MLKATRIKWCNLHDTCLREDRGALMQLDWPSRQLLGNCSCVVLHKDVQMPRAQDALERPLPPASMQSSCVVLHRDVQMPRAQDALERPLDGCSRRRSTASIHGGVPPASLQSLQGSATKSCAQTGVA